MSGRKKIISNNSVSMYKKCVNIILGQVICVEYHGNCCVLSLSLSLSLTHTLVETEGERV